jgi:hypothetical protein
VPTSHGAPLAIAAVAVLATAQVTLASGREAATTGTAIASQRSATGTIISLRSSNGRLTRLQLNSHSHITTGDGRALQPADIYEGDLVTVSTKRLVQDVSQRVQDMKGIVSDAPQETNDPIVVQISGSSTSSSRLAIVVDTDSRTRYSDRSHETSRVTQLQDADILQLHGVYDRALGEMTHTDSISRLGPYHHKNTPRKKS